MDKIKKNHGRIGRSGWKRFVEEHGFTMIEMLVAFAILAVIMAGMFTFLWGVISYWHAGQNAADMTDNARQGLNRMTREIKQASVVNSIGDDQVSFTADFKSGPEIVSYGFSPGGQGQTGTVWRSTSAVPGRQDTLIDNVESLSFTFYGNDYKCDTDGDGITTWSELQACSSDPVSKIARVDINLVLKAGNAHPQIFTEQAWLRNRVIPS